MFKKIGKYLLSAALVLTSVFAITGCKDGDNGDGGASKSAVEAWSANVETVYEGLEDLDYSKFSLRYEEDSNIKHEIVTLEYDVEGYFHSRQYMNEKVVESGKTPKEYTVETYMWVEGTTLTQSYYYKLTGYNNNIPDKKYWVKSFSSVDAALEEFEQYLSERFINDINFLEVHPVDYVLRKNYEHIEATQDNLERYLVDNEKGWTFTINSNEGTSFDVETKLTKTTFENTYSIVAADGYITEYTENNSAGWEIEYSMNLDWTFTAPDLSTYFDFSN